jgi:oxygen-independent coproporphyrinogen-3 oxidase
VNSSVHSALYLSVPFCRSKCSFCNFASGVFSRDLLERYVARLADDIASAPALVRELACDGAAPGFDPVLDSLYLGGGTPSILSPQLLDRLFAAVGGTFQRTPQAEITVEVAPGTLSGEVLAALVRAGVNRVSLGVQSFVDEEIRSVGRLHTRAAALEDVARLREAGIENLSADLIAGLPHQSAESWERSLDDAISLSLPHLSVYMLEVDEDSHLGRELIAGGARYHAHHVPDEALTVALYESAVERLNAAGVAQYEISNFARPGYESRHNLRYWRRLPYFGFGVDAHSMLPAPTAAEPHRALRLAFPDSLDDWLTGAPAARTVVGEREAVEETYFLGLRRNCGVELAAVEAEFGPQAVARYRQPVAELIARGLLVLEGGWLRLTPRGRLLSNEVFAAFLME